ncbi:rhodanese-like domain-containing protein [Gemella sp. GH3]|uniref:rhodanese-like domain-containing protein n=1 Tax=unclassified Gemella TaxID=2624949 RepID=UPI0015CFD2CD|nr:MULTISPECIES: rhodanese-like domain-containing protein [unclassified Gemella]MBF0713665.1 rhodanese-like domain-containing protein [Gemella sp. GH3.1]NYS50617.1 rhodanese-like domain-containing protein [Gemella sp. GH3]
MKIKKIFASVVILVLVITIVGCSTSSNSSTNSSSSGTIKEMSGEELAKIQNDKDKKEKYLVIDVRSEEEYKAGHLQHAINIAVGDVKSNIDKIKFWKEKPVILYCNSGKKSKEAADILIAEGFKDVTNAKGVKEYTDYKLVKYNNILGEDFQKVITEEKGLFLDARKSSDYQKSHVKDAKNVDPDNLGDIEKILPEDKNQAIYTYCYSGNRSGVVAQKLVDLGYTNVNNALDGTKEFDYKF